MHRKQKVLSIYPSDYPFFKSIMIGNIYHLYRIVKIIKLLQLILINPSKLNLYKNNLLKTILINNFLTGLIV
jgi:hypothetical protein